MHEDSQPSLGEQTLGGDALHRLLNVLRHGATSVAIPVTGTVVEALRVLGESGRSHLPVMEDGEIVGLFSHQSFGQGLVYLSNTKAGKLSPVDLPLEHFLIEPMFLAPDTKLDEALREFRERGAVVVGGREDFDRIATLQDVNDFLYRVTRPFLLIKELETAVRALMGRATTAEQLAVCARRAIHTRPGQEPPTRVDQLTFGQYAMIICHEENFPLFEPIFGHQRVLVESRLDPVRQIRNEVFHFKRPLERSEYDMLEYARRWLARRLSVTAPKKHEEANG